MEPELIKKEQKKNKKLTKLFATIAVMLVIGIGGVFAYYQSTDSFENEFKTGKYGAEVTERFISPKDWVPGDKTDKDVTVKNTGSICQNARISYTESWQDKDGNTLPLEKNGVRAAIIEFDNTSDWEKKGDYYYYKEDIMPGQESNSFIKSVTYNSEVNNGYSCETVGNTKTCTVDANGYAGATYTLNIKVETVQCDKKDEAWKEEVTYDYVEVFYTYHEYSDDNYIFMIYPGINYDELYYGDTLIASSNAFDYEKVKKVVVTCPTFISESIYGSCDVDGKFIGYTPYNELPFTNEYLRGDLEIVPFLKKFIFHKDENGNLVNDKTYNMEDIGIKVIVDGVEYPLILNGYGDSGGHEYAGYVLMPVKSSTD